MTDETLARNIVTENRQVWFWMLINYMRMRTFALWLRYYPETSFATFELIWPYLFDQMLEEATRAAVKTLRETPLNEN